jgi:hypothetical protein
LDIRGTGHAGHLIIIAHVRVKNFHSTTARVEISEGNVLGRIYREALRMSIQYQYSSFLKND